MKKLLKSLMPNFLKKALAEALRPFGTPPLRMLNLLAFHGTFTLDVNGKPLRLTYTNKWIENDLFWKGLIGYEKVSMEIWQKAAKDAHTIIDIGANTGFFSLVGKTVNPAAIIYGFEPLPKFRALFQANCDANHYDIHVDKRAVSDFVGSSIFYVPEEFQGNEYSSSLSKEHYLKHQSTEPLQVSVEVTTFDDFMQEVNLGPIDLVKIDAEGHDFEVLAGMKETIRKYQPDFLVEIHSDEIGLNIMSLLPSSSYFYFNIDEEVGARRVPALTKSDTFNFFICKPETAAKLSL